MISSDFGGQIILIILAGVLIGVAAKYIIQFSKGRIEVIVKENLGDKISGEVKILLKKDIPIDRLFVRLIGKRETKQRNRNGKSNTQWKEFYRNEYDIEIKTPIEVGVENVFNFEFKNPNSSKTDGLEQLGNTGAVLSQVANVATNLNLLNNRKRWFLVAHLKTKGIGLKKERNIHIAP